MKKNYLVTMIILTGFSCVAAGLLAPAYPEAKITVKVVDLDGNSVPNAKVSIGFRQGGNAWIGEDKAEIIRGLSDSNGLFAAQARCAGGMSIGVTKDGFYRSYGDHHYPGTYQSKERWEPWNSTNKVVLKEIKNPIPMYVKEIRSVIPETDKEIGFDLERGDWVAPYGNGAVSDFIFYAINEQVSLRDYKYTLLLTFPGQADGIQVADCQQVHEASVLKMNYCAPCDGYLPKWEQFRNRLPEQGETSNIEPERKYYFRVRTKVDKDGNIISAYYGKIHGDFLQFTYYLNPAPNDRNLEFDPEKNLYGGNVRFAP